jgi:hypothetical protein
MLNHLGERSGKENGYPHLLSLSSGVTPGNIMRALTWIDTQRAVVPILCTGFIKCWTELTYAFTYKKEVVYSATAWATHNA